MKQKRSCANCGHNFLCHKVFDEKQCVHGVGQSREVCPCRIYRERPSRALGVLCATALMKYIKRESDILWEKRINNSMKGGAR